MWKIFLDSILTLYCFESIFNKLVQFPIELLRSVIMFRSNDNQQLLPDFLKQEYPEIYKSINDEGYIIEYPTFQTLKEIHFEDKVVGFITINTFHIIPTDLVINECYIIPEYRGNNLLYNELFRFITTPNANFHLRNPNKALIKVLLKTGMAGKISDNLVVSYIKFVVMIDTVYKNPKIKQFYKRTDDKVPYKANLFDMDLCSVLFLDPALEYVKFSDVLVLTLPRKNDLKKYKLRKKLKKVNESYLDKCYDTRQENRDEVIEFTEDVENFIYKTIAVENVLGTSEELKPDFIKYLNDNDLTEEDGFKIINHINKALDEGHLIPESCHSRMQYLVGNIDALDTILDDGSDDCPFCGRSNLDFIETCEFCGEKIKDESYADELIEKISNFDFEALMGDLNDSLDLDDILERVPIEENDPLFELKTFYNDYLTGFDFEEIKQYYLNSNEEESIGDLMEDYFDKKILNENNDDDKFKIYSDYLCSFFYCYLDNKQFDDALAHIIQLAILSSNKDDVGEGNIIERKPHSIDVHFEIDQFLNNNPTFDLDNSYKIAIDNFKVQDLLNNEKEVFSAISELLT